MLSHKRPVVPLRNKFVEGLFHSMMSHDSIINIVKKFLHGRSDLKLAYRFRIVCHEIWTLTGTISIRNPLRDDAFIHPTAPASQPRASGRPIRSAISAGLF